MGTKHTRKKIEARRPSDNEREATVAVGQMISWALPGGKKDRFEMLSPDDLLTRKGWRVYREMMADDQVKACLWYKKVLLCGRPYDLKPAPEDGVKGKEAADFIHKNLLDINFQSLLWECLSAFEFGFSAGELLWEIKGGYPSKDAPRLHLRTIKFRDPEYMYIEIDKHGNLTGFVQKPSQGPELREIRLPPEKVFHYAYQRQFSNHYGMSDLRAAYRAWWSKKYITQFWNVFLERFGAPLMLMKYPAGATSELKNDLKAIMNGLSSKTDVLVPEGVVVELIEATRAGQASYDEALVHYDVRIATSTLIPALLGMGVDTKRGSDSQSRLHLRTLMKVIQFIGNELGKEIQDKIIKPMCDSNFEGLKSYPQFIFQDYGEFEAFEITDAIKELFSSGLIAPDQEDVNFARSILGMPVRTDENPDEITNLAVEALDVQRESNQMRADAKKQSGGQSGNKNAKKPISSRKTNPRDGRTRPSRRRGN